MGKMFRVALLASTALLLLHAQDARPTFDAASFKVNDSGAQGTSSHGSKGQIVFTNMPLRRLMERAYSVAPYQIAGPDWIDSVRFDVAGKYPPDAKLEERPLMLRALLEDRLKLAVHRESKEMPGYALVVAKSGFKLKPAEPGGIGMDNEGGRIQTLSARKTSMEALAAFVARQMNEVVVDGTGLSGVYDFALRWTNEDLPADGGVETAPTLATALQETLGLRLQPRKVPVPIIVIDRAERVPVEN
jgi:uncharacterized protein (TIGR03435 family)